MALFAYTVAASEARTREVWGANEQGRDGGLARGHVKRRTKRSLEGGRRWPIAAIPMPREAHGSFRDRGAVQTAAMRPSACLAEAMAPTPPWTRPAPDPPCANMPDRRLPGRRSAAIFSPRLRERPERGGAAFIRPLRPKWRSHHPALARPRGHGRRRRHRFPPRVRILYSRGLPRAPCALRSCAPAPFALGPGTASVALASRRGIAE